MFLELLYPLTRYFSPLNVFRYLTFRSAYAAVTALLLAFIFGPKLIARLRVLKFGQSERADGPQSHLSKSGTPTMGGLLIIISVAVAVLLWSDLHSLYMWTAMGALLGFGLVGFLDDWLKIKYHNSDGLPAWAKFLGQTIVATVVVLVLYFSNNPETTKFYLPFFKNAIGDMGVWWIPFAIVYVVGWSNAVNLSDGLDGLATGLVIMALIAFAILTYVTGRADWSAYLQIPFIKGSGELTVFILALIGACVGFLWFNCHPAEVFMGDAGSLALGGVLGVFSLMVKKEVLLLIVGGVFVIEVASDILQVCYFKLTHGKRLFKMAPLHHHFELKGWAETKVVTRFWILGGLFAIIALTTLKIQ